MNSPIHWSCWKNPCAPQGNDAFTHYEIHSVREYEAPDGCRFVEPVLSGDDIDNECGVGPVYYTIYGRHRVGGVEALVDCDTLESAQRVLRCMGALEEGADA